MRTLDNMLSEQMEDTEFRKEYESVQPKMEEVLAKINARTSHNTHSEELLPHPIQSTSYALPIGSTTCSIDSPGRHTSKI